MGKLRATRGEGAPDWEASAATLTCSERRLHAGSRGSGDAQTQIHTAAAKSRPRDRRAHPAGRFRPPHVTPQAGQGGTGVRAGPRPLSGPAQSRSWSPLAPLALQRVSPLSLASQRFVSVPRGSGSTPTTPATESPSLPESPCQQCIRVPFSLTTSTTLITYLVDDSHSNKYEGYLIDLHFPNS